MDELTLAVGWGEDPAGGLSALAKDRPGSWHEFTGGGLPCPVRLRIGLDTQGRPVCTGVLLVDEAGVDSRTLRAIPLRRLLTYLSAEPRSLTSGEVDFDDATAAIVAELVALGAVETEESPERPAIRRGRPPLTDEALCRFMAVYNDVRRRQATADAPVKAVADAMHMSRAAAHRWLRTARERGITGEGAR